MVIEYGSSADFKQSVLQLVRPKLEALQRDIVHFISVSGGRVVQWTREAEGDSFMTFQCLTFWYGDEDAASISAYFQRAAEHVGCYVSKIWYTDYTAKAYTVEFELRYGT